MFAVEQLIETITIIGPPASFISPGGTMNFYLGGPLFIIFFLALGVALSLEQAEEPTTARRRPEKDEDRYIASDITCRHQSSC